MQSNDRMELLKSSFDAHAALVLIHPWQDGNKRTSRLVMNYMQRRAGLPLTKVHKDNVTEYLAALRQAKDNGDFEPFRRFMATQHIRTLRDEIAAYRALDDESEKLLNNLFPHTTKLNK
jgi:Fic family protein